MQVDSPHHAPSTLAEFFRQYAMVVLSILTALALEHLAVGWQNAAAARASLMRIDTELAQNTTDLKESQRSNAVNVGVVRTAERALVELLGKPAPDADATMRIITPALDHFGISVQSWQREAWDAAIADQSASHMAPAALQRYAAIYTAEHDLETTATLLLGGEWLTHFTTLLVDVRLHKVDPRQMADQMVRYLLAVGQIEAGQRKLETLMEAHAAP